MKIAKDGENKHFSNFQFYFNLLVESLGKLDKHLQMVHVVKS